MYIHTTDYKFKHIYNIETLKGYSDYCERDIKRLEELIVKVREYQMDLYTHVQDVLNTPFKNIVKLQRRIEYSSNKVKFFVSVEERPLTDKKQIDGNHIYGKFKHEKCFEGKERNKAIQYADELASKYHT